MELREERLARDSFCTLGGRCDPQYDDCVVEVLTVHAAKSGQSDTRKVTIGA